MDDRELLAEYVERRSPEAFGALVERYVHLVYSAAARQAGDQHLAEDVTQGVFLVLAQKAGRLRRETVLGAWLLKVTRYAALDAMKMAARRRTHEERAAYMRPETDTTDDAARWAEIRGVLDEALVNLPEKDRRVIVLRFFEQRSVEDVAERMGVTREAAKQRLFRAIEKLRARLGSKGATVPAAAAALAALIGARAVEAAPVGLAGSTVAAATVSGTSGSAVAFGIAKGTVNVMAWAKVKIAATVAAAALVVGSTTALVVMRVIRPGDGDDHDRARDGRAYAAVPVVHQRTAAGDAATVKDNADWWPRFHAVYGLAAGQTVKRVPPPFIDQRWNFWKSQQPSIPPLKPGEMMPEKVFIIEWDGAAYHWKVVAANDGRLGMVMTSLLGLREWEVDAPQALKDAPLPGDWVVLKGATFADKLAAVEGIARDAGLKIRIKETTKLIEVVVARGELKFTGPVDEHGRPVLELRYGQAFPQAGGPVAPPPPPASSATMREVFDQAESMFAIPFIDESGSELSRVMLRQFPGYSKSRETAMEKGMLSLMEQTGLLLEKEKRELTVWVVTEE
jgi:RNA polymerase sigma factor (sigma-70 family)